MIDPEVRAEWRKSLFSFDAWDPEDPPRIIGTAERVHRGPFIAWLKPLRFRSDRSEAGREKLAADLGHELGAPVAPVLLLPPPLWRSDAPQCVVLQVHELHASVPTHEKATSSALMLAQPHLRPAHVPAEALAFDALVNILDRCSGNWMMGRGARGGPAQLLLLDHAMAFHTLDGPLPRLPEEMLEPLRRLSDETITDIVARIPCTFLDASVAKQIAAQLVRRKARLLAGATDPERNDWATPLHDLQRQLHQSLPPHERARHERLRRARAGPAR